MYLPVHICKLLFLVNTFVCLNIAVSKTLYLHRVVGRPFEVGQIRHVYIRPPGNQIYLVVNNLTTFIHHPANELNVYVHGK